MLFLSKAEKEQWTNLTQAIQQNRTKPVHFQDDLRANLRPAFCFHVGAILADAGQGELGRAWINAGAMIEADGLFSNTYLAGFLKRHQGRLATPETVFADPRPYVHFTTVPVLREARERLLRSCGHTLSEFNRPLRLMDIGCGDGSLTARLLAHLRDCGKVGDIGEVLLVDPSPAMLELARAAVGKVAPPEVIRTLNRRIEETGGEITAHYDLAFCSLSYHHMPRERKLIHLRKLRHLIDNLFLFELDANNDLPELHTPELSFSVYQSYGRMLDFVFAHDAPIDVAQHCADCFLMTEAVSLLTQPRGKRNDYHMTRCQWLELFETTLAPEFQCRANSTCYADEYFDLFTMHFART